MKKYIKNGKVAVIISPNFGAGFSTWNTQYPDIMFDPELVQMILDKKSEEEIETVVKQKYPDAYFGFDMDFHIVWLKQGTKFCIEEYDGAESIRTIEDFVLEA